LTVLRTAIGSGDTLPLLSAATMESASPPLAVQTLGSTPR
jgi:hypothetical protein